MFKERLLFIKLINFLNKTAKDIAKELYIPGFTIKKEKKENKKFFYYIIKIKGKLKLNESGIENMTELILKLNKESKKYNIKVIDYTGTS